MLVEKTEIERPQEAELAYWTEHFRAAPPHELLRWAGERWGAQLVLTCSFGGAAGMVLLDMVLSHAPETPVLYADTELLFPETYALITRVHERYGVMPQPIRPARTVAQQAEVEGPALWKRDPDRCCQMRKVQPLGEALAPFDAWIAGLRRDTSPTRAGVKQIGWSTKYNLVKLNPLAFWTEREVWGYIFKYDVPYNPLLDQGYRSIGCLTCTRLPESDDPRAGRWAGFNKVECGLHVEA